jgi:uncharacterized protein YuzE
VVHTHDVIPVRVTYDPEADAAYFYLVEEIRLGEAVRTVSVDPQSIGGMVNLDLDADGRILGLEVLDASRLLRRDVLPEG